ncbi:hypothetical protein [Sorangium sp. So ce1024]|uniref:hypothetical protein n=1 Tax=Sorangium sp. So ce1024 TaxID=3133327 RepID=UPI003F10BD76
MPPPLTACPARAGSVGAYLGGAILVATYVLPVLDPGAVLCPVAAASLLALLFLAWRSRRPHGFTATALGLTLLFPALIAHAYLLLEQRVALGSRSLGIDMLDVAIAAWAAPLVGGLLGCLGSLLASHLLRRERAWLPPALHSASLMTLTMTAALVAGAGVRLIQRPALDRYAASLPVVAVLPPALGEPSRVVRGGGSSPSGGELRVHEDAVAELLILRTCNDAECTVMVALASEPPLAWGVPHRAQTVDAAASLAVRRNSAGDLVLIEPRRIPGRLHDPADPRPLAFQGPHLASKDIYPRDLVRVAGPPLSWSAVGAAGVLFAGFVLRRRRRVKARLDRLASAPAGTRDERGWITFDEALPDLRLAPGDDGPTGRVLVLSGAEERAVAYRDARQPGPVEVVHGERDELMAEVQAELVRLDALAFAAVLLTATPLHAAAWRGLVF